MIGELRNIRTPYYDKVARSVRFKVRPGLIIGNADSDDYVVLPVSKVSDRSKVDQRFDIPVDPAAYPDVHLTVFSYVRTHKQTVVHASLIGKSLGSVKDNYEELYLEILTRRDEFNSELTDKAL